MTYSEAVLNLSLLHPCISATVTFLQNASKLEPYFAPGEGPSRAISEQLTIIGSKVDNRKIYNADGIICLHKLYDLEVLLLETSDNFQNKDKKKISFDNIKKEMLALLAMIKTAADRFSYASVELLQKLKLYLIQASDEYLRLWSIQYVSNGTYQFNREIVIMEDKSQAERVLNPLLDFSCFVKAPLFVCCYTIKLNFFAQIC